MGRYLVMRVYSMALTLLGLTLLVFLMLRLIPGTVVEQMIGADAVMSQQMVDQLKRFFGLDQPWYVQYGRWLGQLAPGRPGDLVAHGKAGPLPDPRAAPGHRRAHPALRRRLAGPGRVGRRPVRGPPRPADRPRHPDRHPARALGAGLLAGHDADPVLLALPPLDAARSCGSTSSPTPGATSPSCSCPRSASAPRRPPTWPGPRGPACWTSSDPTTCGPPSPRGSPAASSS